MGMASMPSKDDLTNERRAQILQAAATVFARSGVNGARMDDIVAESGLSKGSLYWYFDSKQEIVNRAGRRGSPSAIPAA